MNYKNTTLGALTVILGVAVFSIYFSPKKEIKRTLKLDPTLKIINLTEERDLDTITSVTLTALKLKNVNVVLVSLSPEEIYETNYLGYVQRWEDFYLIRIRPGLTKDLIIEIISHEMIHLYHNEKGRLKTLYYGIEFDGLVYTPRYPYYLKPFEIIAYKLEWPLKMYVKSILYKTTNPNCL